MCLLPPTTLTNQGLNGGAHCLNEMELDSQGDAAKPTTKQLIYERDHINKHFYQGCTNLKLILGSGIGANVDYLFNFMFTSDFHMHVYHFMHRQQGDRPHS